MAPLVKPTLETRVQAAIGDLRSHRYPSIRRAAAAHSLSIATLARRYRGGHSATTGQTSNQLLTTSEETQLVQWLNELTERNVPARVNMINSMAATIIMAREDGNTRRVGSRWYRAFLSRHPGITTKLSRNLDRARATAFTPTLVSDWFNLFQNTMEKYNVTLDRVYNMDETGIAMGLIGRSMVVVPRSGADRYLQQPGNRNWVSILETINGTGAVLPPFLIFKGKSHQWQWYPRNAPAGWSFAISDNGWTDEGLATAWLKDHFEMSTRPTTPGAYRLLLLDGHSSHKSWEFLEYCQSHQIIVLCLPPHTTHKLQPLDVGCFQASKHHYQRAVEEEGRRGYTAIEKYQFINIYQQVRPLAFDERHIQRAWTETGLIPLNPDVIFDQLPGVQPPSTPVKPRRSPSPSVIPSSSTIHLTPPAAITTPKTMKDLHHQHQKFTEFSSFSSIDASPCRARYIKILHAAENTMLENNILRARYNQLQAAHANVGHTKRTTRRRLPQRGRVLSVVDLRQVEDDARLDGDASSDLDESEDEVVTWLNQQVVAGPEDAESVARETEAQGYRRCVRHFKVLDKPRRR